MIVSDIVLTGSNIFKQTNIKAIFSELVNQSLDMTKADISCFYLFDDSNSLNLFYKHGRYSSTQLLNFNSELIEFILDNQETIIKNNRQPGFFDDVFLHDEMQSAIALLLKVKEKAAGVLILNSKQSGFFNRERFLFLESMMMMASSRLCNFNIDTVLKQYLKKA